MDAASPPAPPAPPAAGTPAGPRRWTGLAVTVLTVAALEAFALLGYRVPNPPAFVLLAVVFAAYTGGLWLGLASAAIGWAYFAWSFSLPGTPFRYDEANFARVLIWALATPVMALLVGTLRREADRSRAQAVRVAAAEASAQAIAVAYEALRASERRYRTLAATMVEGILILQEGRFTYANPGALGLLGYTMEELQGREFAPLIHPDFRDLVSERHRSRSAGEVLETHYDIRILTRTGEPRWVQIANERTDWDGQPAVLTVISDIEARKRAEAQVRALNAELEQRVEARTAELKQTVQDLESFCYTISHDLRAPLRALNSYAHILREESARALSESALHDLGRIEANALQMSRLLDGLLEFARVGQAALNCAPVSMHALATEIVDELRPGAADGAQVTVDALPECHGDALLLRQVWRNLVSNALKYSAEAAAPHVRIGFDAERRAYTVRDNGVGFDMQHATRLFGVFSRLHAPGRFEGTGVGLAIVQRIVQRHGGRVWAEAEPGRGATFCFTVA